MSTWLWYLRGLTCESVDDTRTATVRTAACERHPARSRPRVVGGDDEGLVAVSSHELTLAEWSLLRRPDAVDVFARRVVGDVRRFPRFVDARFALHHRLGRLHTTLLRTFTCTLYVYEKHMCMYVWSVFYTCMWLPVVCGRDFKNTNSDLVEETWVLGLELPRTVKHEFTIVSRTK